MSRGEHVRVKLTGNLTGVGEEIGIFLAVNGLHGGLLHGTFGIPLAVDYLKLVGGTLCNQMSATYLLQQDYLLTSWADRFIVSL